MKYARNCCSRTPTLTKCVWKGLGWGRIGRGWFSFLLHSQGKTCAAQKSPWARTLIIWFIGCFIQCWSSLMRAWCVTGMELSSCWGWAGAPSGFWLLSVSFGSSRLHSGTAGSQAPVRVWTASKWALKAVTESPAGEWCKENKPKEWEPACVAHCLPFWFGQRIFSSELGAHAQQPSRSARSGFWPCEILGLMSCHCWSQVSI